MLRLARIHLLVVAALAACAASRLAAETITYTLTPLPERGSLQVELTWDTKGRERSEMGVSPRWGDVADVPALLTNVQFTGISGAHRDGGRWIIDHRRSARIQCSYEVTPGRRTFDWSGTHYPITTRRLFHGMGNAFLITPVAGDGRDLEALLRWKLPRGWKAVCSWGNGPSIGATISAADLKHSVYMAGEFATANETRNGHTVTVAVAGYFKFTAQEFATMAADIVAQQCEFMGEKDFPRFLVTAIAVGEPMMPGSTRLAGAGLYNSFALFVAPGAELSDAVEHLFAHELFHFWNGRMLKGAEPDELVYWFTEGLTDYYSLRILHESGHWDADTFTKWLNKHLREYASNPAALATNEEIRAKYHSERDTVGEVAYQRGLALGLRWHRLAQDRGVKGGFDRLFRALVQRGRDEGFQLSNDAIRQAGIDQLGAWFGAEFDKYVTGAARVDIPADALAPIFTASRKTVYEFDLGFDRDQSLSEQRVRGLKADSAAARAGLRDGETLLAWKLTSDPDQQVELTVVRESIKRIVRYFPRGAGLDAIQFTAEAAKPKKPRR